MALDYVLAEDGSNILDEMGLPVQQEGGDVRAWFVLAEDGADMLDESSAPVLQEDVILTQFSSLNPRIAAIIKS